LNNDKDNFIRILAHDLKNPFNTLLGFSQLLLKNIEKYDKPKIKDLLLVIVNTTQQTYELLEQILLWAKTQSGRMEFNPQAFSFLDITNDVVNSVSSQAKPKNIQINVFETERIHVTADLNAYRTVVRNLISNAIKFSFKDGLISVFAMQKQTEIIVTVSDSGVGIEKNNISKIWDISSHYSTRGTANEQGTGFGLILCKELIEKHGGQIWVESNVGKGSDFKFTLPKIIA